MFNKVGVWSQRYVSRLSTPPLLTSGLRDTLATTFAALQAFLFQAIGSSARSPLSPLLNRSISQSRRRTIALETNASTAAGWFRPRYFVIVPTPAFLERRFPLLLAPLLFHTGFWESQASPLRFV